MFVRDELKALRGDNKEARTHRVAMEEALEDCRREPRLAAVLEELLRYGEEAILPTFRPLLPCSSTQGPRATYYGL